MSSHLEFDEKNVWQAVILITVVASYFFLKPFLGVVIFTALIAFMSNPIYKKLRKVFKKRDTLAATATLFTSIFAFLVPLAIIIVITIGQVAALFTQVRDSNFGDGIQVANVFEVAAERINGLARATGNEGELIQADSIKNILTERVPGLVNVAIDQTVATASGIPRFIAYFVLYCFLLIGFLTQQQKIVSSIRKLSPFQKRVTDMYLNKASSMTIAMAKGQFLIALAAGALSSLSLLVAGIDYFFFFLLFLTFLSFIPLGAGIITIPIGIVLLLTGEVWQGMFLILFHFIVITNLDNFMRPRLVPKDAHLQPSLTLLATFAGVYYFGLLGVIYGPVLMVLIVTTLSTYQRVKAGEHKIPEQTKA